MSVFLVAPGGGSWNSAATWLVNGSQPGAPPTAADDVTANSSSGNLVITASSVCNNLNFGGTGYTGTVSSSSGALAVSGNLSMAAGVNYTATASITMNATAAKTITTNGILINTALTLNGVGGSWQLQDDYITSSVSSSISLTNGAFDSGNKNINVAIFGSSNSNTRSIALGTSTINIRNNWGTLTTTGLTLDALNATIKITRATAIVSSFTSGAASYGTVWYTGDNFTNAMRIGVANVTTNIKTLRIDPHTDGSTALFQGIGLSTTSVNNFLAIGNAANPITMQVSSGTSNWVLTKSGVGQILCNYLTISNSTATPSSTWFAGRNSTDAGSNSGWIFTSQPPAPGTACLLGVGR